MEKRLVVPIPTGDRYFIDALGGERTLTGSENILKMRNPENFENWGINRPSFPTEKTIVSLGEVADKGSYLDIFLTVSPGGLEYYKISFSADQVIDFCNKNPGAICKRGYPNRFLVKVLQNDLTKTYKFYVFVVYSCRETLAKEIGRLSKNDGGLFKDARRLSVDVFPLYDCQVFPENCGGYVFYPKQEPEIELEHLKLT